MMFPRPLTLLASAALLVGCATAPPEPLPTPELRTGAELAEKVSKDTDAQLTKEGTRAVLHGSSITPKKPKAKPKPPPKPSAPITLTIAKDGAATIAGGDALPGATLEEKLQSLYQKDPKTPVVLQSDASVAFGRAVEVMDLVRKVGFQNVSMKSSPPPTP